MLKRKVVSVAVAAVWMGGAAHAQTYAPWLTQIGVNRTIASQAKYGSGLVLGVVDTGLNPQHRAFQSWQISSASSCAGITFGCPNRYYDEYGHGTAVAGIAAANRTNPYSNYYVYNVAANSVVGVATQARIVAEKVFSASAQSTFTDVANGIRRAADAGASVINVSISYWNGAEVVSAINHAASKGAMIVWAGGNDAAPLMGGADTVGLSPDAIRQLIFAGSVTPWNALSGFSNTPGSGGLVGTNGARTPVSSRWAMAPGEGILAPYSPEGNNGWAAWTGTSMSAPLVAGSLVLLETAWPILKTRRTAANLLLSTASDLGTPGEDPVYGLGLISLQRAFQPSGTLSVTQSSGQTVAVTSLTGSMITGGALGGMTRVRERLANYTAFDGYERNFTVDLSGLIRPRTLASSGQQPVLAQRSSPVVTRLAEGGELAYWRQPTLAEDASMRLGAFGLNTETYQDRRMGFAALTDTRGTTMAFGYGFPVHFSYGQALYGQADFARLSGELGSLGLSGLAQGGGMAAFGTPLGESTRVAFSWSGTPTVYPGTLAAWTPGWTQPNASALSLGFSHRLNDVFTLGFTVGSLSENQGLLGTTYDASSPLGLSSSNRSRSIGFSAGLQLDARNSVLFDVGYAATDGTQAATLFTGASGLVSRSSGVTFLSKGLVTEHDRLTLSVKQPLRVVSGKVGLLVPGVDELGIPRYTTEWASVVPDGREIQYGLGYERPLGRDASLSFHAGYRKDVWNLPGSRDKSASAMWSLRF